MLNYLFGKNYAQVKNHDFRIWNHFSISAEVFVVHEGHKKFQAMGSGTIQVHKADKIMWEGYDLSCIKFRDIT